MPLHPLHLRALTPTLHHPPCALAALFSYPEVRGRKTTRPALIALCNECTMQALQTAITCPLTAEPAEPAAPPPPRSPPPRTRTPPPRGGGEQGQIRAPCNAAKTSHPLQPLAFFSLPGGKPKTRPAHPILCYPHPCARPRNQHRVSWPATAHPPLHQPPPALACTPFSYPGVNQKTTHPRNPLPFTLHHTPCLHRPAALAS